MSTDNPSSSPIAPTHLSIPLLHRTPGPKPQPTLWPLDAPKSTKTIHFHTTSHEALYLHLSIPVWPSEVDPSLFTRLQDFCFQIRSRKEDVRAASGRPVVPRWFMKKGEGCSGDGGGNFNLNFNMEGRVLVRVEHAVRWEGEALGEVMMREHSEETKIIVGEEGVRVNVEDMGELKIVVHFGEVEREEGFVLVGGLEKEMMTYGEKGRCEVM